MVSGKLFTGFLKACLAVLVVFTGIVLPSTLTRNAFAETEYDSSATAPPGSLVIYGDDASNANEGTDAASNREGVPGAGFDAADLSGGDGTGNGNATGPNITFIAPQAASGLVPFDTTWTAFNEVGINALIAMAVDSGEPMTIHLANNIETTDTIIIPEGTDITLAGEYVLKRMNDGIAIFVAPEARLTIDGITVTHALGVTGEGVYSRGSLHLVSGSISRNIASPIFTEIPGYEMFISGGAGGGVCVDYSTFTMSGGTISGNSAGTGGGVFLSIYSTFTMTGGTISGNSADTGGGVHIGTSSTFTMSNSTISGNSAGSGGGVYAGVGSTFTMSNSTISGNTATSGGGVRTHADSTFSLISGDISVNTATTNGGGVFIQNGTFNMSGGTISGNVVGISGVNGFGGGVYNSAGFFNMTAGSVSENESTFYGGGIYNDKMRHAVGGYDHGSTFTMTGGDVSGNKAVVNGGGFYNGGTCILEGGTISGNTAGEKGGGILFDNLFSGGQFISGGTAVVSGNTIDDTTANNVEFIEGAYIILGNGTNGASAPAAGMNVGITKTADATVFVLSGASEYQRQFFRSDDATKKVVHDSGKLMLGDKVPIDVSSYIAYASGSATFSGIGLSHETASISGIIPGPNPSWGYLYSLGDAPKGSEMFSIDGRPLIPGNYKATATYLDDDGNFGIKTVAFTVLKATQAAPIDALTISEVTTTSFKVSAKNLAEKSLLEIAYSTTDTPPATGWATVGEGIDISGLSPATTYYVFARYRESVTHFVSPSSVTVTYTLATSGTVEYTVIKHFGTWEGEDEATSIIDAPLAKFERLMLGALEVSPDNYTVSGPQTTITLAEDYLKTLANSTYTYIALFTDGFALLTLTVEVTDDPPPVDDTIRVTGLTLDKSSLTLVVGDIAQLIATIAPTNATNKNISWTSSNTSVATVDSTGKVTALKAGITTVIATSEDGLFIGRCDVTVTNPASVAQPTGTSVPKTGDESNTAVWSVLLITSLVGLTVCTAIGWRLRRKTQSERDES